MHTESILLCWARSITCHAALLAASATWLPAYSLQTGDEALPAAEVLLDRHVDATGGRRAHLEITSRKRIGKLVADIGGHEYEARVEETTRSPSGRHLLLEGSFFAQLKACNGTDAWEWWAGHEGTGPGTTELLDGSARARAIEESQFHAAVDWRNRIANVETIDLVDVNRSPAYEVRLTTKTGEQYTQFYDRSTGRLVKRIRSTDSRPWGPIEMEIFFEEYREFDDVWLPTRLRINLNSAKLGSGTEFWSYTAIEHNRKIAASLFELPEEFQLDGGPARSRSAASEEHAPHARGHGGTTRQEDDHEVVVPLRRSSVSVSFPPDTSVVDLPFHVENGLIVIELYVNASELLTFALDTGSPGAVLLNPAVIEGTELELGEKVPIGGAGSGGPRMTARPARDVHFDVGGVLIEGASLLVMSGTNFAQLWDGIIGRQLFANVVVEIDWQRKRVRLHDPSTFVAPSDAVSVSIENRGGHIYAPAEVTIDGVITQVMLLVDTGSGGALSLLSERVEPSAEREVGVTIGRGMSGLIKGDVGRVDRLRFGGTSLEGVKTSFVSRDDDVIAPGADGSLGTDVLRRFVVTFDFGNKRMLLQLPAGFKKAPPDSVAR